MIRECIGSILFIVVFASPAYAQVQCTGPFLPVVPDGATTTEEELITIRGQVEAFMRDSDGYQRCLVASLRQLQAAAASDEDEEFDPAIRRRIEARVNANQNHKIRVSEEFNAAARAYNDAQSPDENQADPAASAPPES
jgi:hypothetical protein